MVVFDAKSAVKVTAKQYPNRAQDMRHRAQKKTQVNPVLGGSLVSTGLRASAWIM